MPPELVEKLRIMPQGFPVLIDENDKWGGLNTIGTPGAWDYGIVLERGNNQHYFHGTCFNSTLAWSCYDNKIDIMTETPAKHLVG